MSCVAETLFRGSRAFLDSLLVGDVRQPLFTAFSVKVFAATSTFSFGQFQFNSIVVACPCFTFVHFHYFLVSASCKRHKKFLVWRQFRILLCKQKILNFLNRIWGKSTANLNQMQWKANKNTYLRRTADYNFK